MAKQTRAQGASTKKENLHELFLNKLKALYDVEQQIIKALPKMEKAATSKELKKGFSDHLKETKEHAARLEQIFDMMGVKPGKLVSEAIRGLIKDGEWVIKNVKDKNALDANLIAAAQYVEHYEMAGYGTAREWAKLMGHDDAAELLDTTLTEESTTNEKLNELATSEINDKANDM
jgi:ferritin-like metal-binding protein YciE